MDIHLTPISKLLGQTAVRAECETEQLHGGSLGDVKLVAGTAETAGGERLPFKLVWKTQKQWERYGDPDSWRREYDLYKSELGTLFTGALRWPECYHAEDNGGGIALWMEYIDGVSGLDLTGEMYQQAALELGRFQGRLYAERPNLLQSLTNLSGTDAMKNFYRHYRSWDVVYNYIRSEGCGIPKHLCQMMIETDEEADEIWSRIERLPVVLCHRDFWVTNIFHTGGGIRLIDWDTTGWGHLGEDIVSLIADEADVDHMVEYCHTCAAAYGRGFSEFAGISPDLLLRERIILHFGYRLVEWYLNAETDEGKALQAATLQKIYEMKEENAC